jgi:hypothetical protein
MRTFSGSFSEQEHAQIPISRDSDKNEYRHKDLMTGTPANRSLLSDDLAASVLLPVRHIPVHPV